MTTDLTLLKCFGTGPRPCDWCAQCNTSLAGGPSGHSTDQRSHEMIETDVELDVGMGKLSRCTWCLKTKKQLEGQPMKPWVQS